MHNFLRKLLTSHLFNFTPLSYWSCYFFWWFIRRQVICTNVQDEIIRTVPYWWFYMIFHAYCFCTWKGFNKYFTICVLFFDISHALRCFTILSRMANIDFSFFFPSGLSFLWSSTVIFCGLQLRSNDLTTVMFLVTFSDASSSCLSFWLSFSLLQKPPEVFLFWFPCCRWFLYFVVVSN